MLSGELKRLEERNHHSKNWSLWGNYLAERQWGTVREDYSAKGDAWNYFSHDDARSRTYRWGEDGLAGICDERQRLCFALSLWNGQDAILKERLFGLTNAEGNHGEDVKELYYYLDNLPSHALMRTLYKYPQTAFPYQTLLTQNRNRSRLESEFELLDTGIFNQNRYFDVQTTYFKADVEDILIEIKVTNHADVAAPIWILPTLWLRNRWHFGLEDKKEARLRRIPEGIEATHSTLGKYLLSWETLPNQVLFTENETNTQRIFGIPNATPFVKDAFHEAILHQNDLFQHQIEGSKAAPVYPLQLQGGETRILKLRLSIDNQPFDFKTTFDPIAQTRQAEADAFYTAKIRQGADADTFAICRQAYAGLLWSKQFYEYDVAQWLRGDKGLPPPPAARYAGRNADWQHFKAADVILMPDKWEYPWFAGWDLAFQAVAIAPIDPVFAQNQLLLLFSDRYRAPSGELPAYEWRFGDTNPPIQAWAAWKIYRTQPSIPFLKQVFEALLPYYHYWLEQKDSNKNNLFSGGFLGLDNISVFDRSSGIPDGGQLEQADGTAWMAFFAIFLLRITTELAATDNQYEKYCIQFFTDFERITIALEALRDAETGLFFDTLVLPEGTEIPLKVHSLISILPLLAALPLEKNVLDALPNFKKAVLRFFNEENPSNESLILSEMTDKKGWFLSLSAPDRLSPLLEILSDSSEMLSQYGLRSVSKIHQFGYAVQVHQTWFGMKYIPSESDSGLFGGNSNWRGPI
ncbi:MAG: hypothetical protein RLZZ628_898 [Bacteroidota bacterium]|jgi:hypothetical protein